MRESYIKVINSLKEQLQSTTKSNFHVQNVQKSLEKQLPVDKSLKQLSVSEIIGK